MGESGESANKTKEGVDVLLKKKSNNNADRSGDEKGLGIPVVQDSDSHSDEDEVAQPKDSGREDGGGVEEEETIRDIANKRTNGTLENYLKKKKKRSHRRNQVEKDEDGTGGSYRFPMSRISRIIKSEGSGIHISQDAVFLINKASEKFLELFSKEAYACAFLDNKQHLEYKHLSSFVSKRKRFDFLSDFVPEKVKAGDALKEMSSAET